MTPPAAIPDIHQLVVDYADAGRPFALATILKDTGSTPRRAGTKALVRPDGSIVGTIGGGRVEAEAQRRAVEAIRTGRPIVFDFALEGLAAKDDRPICGGSMRILIDPTAGASAAVYAQAALVRRDRQRGLLLTTIRGADQVKVSVEWVPQESAAAQTDFPGGDALASVLAAQAPRLFVQDLGPPRGEMPHFQPHLEVLAEPLAPPPLLLIAGGGHVGQALALQASWVGFEVAVIDDRREFTDLSLYPHGVSTRCGDMADELARFPIAGDTYIVIVTRGHQDDQRALAACVHSSAAYVGMIGSRRKVALIREDLLASAAASQAELDRVYAPIGLDIGAQTVPEIAASIVAQLIAVWRKGSGAGRRSS